MSGRATLLALAALAGAMPASGEAPRELCADRPGLGTPACTLDKGHAVLETGIIDWTRDDQGPLRADTILAGDLLLRVGVTDHMEARIGWTAFGHVRTRDGATGTIDTASGVGDVMLAVRRNLSHPDGSGFSIALMPSVTLPVGGAAIGGGDWGAGLKLPASVDLGGPSLALTSEIDAAVDSDGHGRHLAYGSSAGLSEPLTAKLSATEEIALYRDEDPAGASSQALAGLSLAWQPDRESQWDVGLVVGLNHDSPDVEIAAGFVRRF